MPHNLHTSGTTAPDSAGAQHCCSGLPAAPFSPQSLIPQVQTVTLICLPRGVDPLMGALPVVRKSRVLCRTAGLAGSWPLPARFPLAMPSLTAFCRNKKCSQPVLQACFKCRQRVTLSSRSTACTLLHMCAVTC